MVSPQYLRYAAGSEKEKGAGGRLHGDTIAHPFVFCKGGVAEAPDSGVRPATGTGGIVLACALDQGRVWLGVRRCPTGPPSNVLGYRGTRCTLLGERGGVAFSLWRVQTLPNFPRVRGHGRGLPLAGAIVPPSPPASVFWYRGTRCTPGGGCAPCTPLGDGGCASFILGDESGAAPLR